MADATNTAAASEYGEEAYAAKGRPLFGKIWSYEELQTVERPGRPNKKSKAQPIQKPANWPADTQVDVDSRWVFWLPEGWMQGIRTSAAGKTLKCYFTPEGRRFWHKRDIEKHLGYDLPTMEPPVPKEENGEAGPKRVKYVTDPDCIPNWPEDEEDWLPKDWRLVFRQLPSGPHRCYIPPGQDEGFLYHRSVVMQWLSGEKRDITEFGISRPQAERSLDAVSPGGSASRPAKRHRPHADAPAQPLATPEDFAETPALLVAPLPLSAESEGGPNSVTATLREAGVEDPDAALREGRAIFDGLVARGFPQDTDLLFVGRRAGTAAAAEQDGYGPLLLALSGLYYRMPGVLSGRSCYQRVHQPPGEENGRIGCGPAYVFWSARSRRWQIGALDDCCAGLAHCSAAGLADSLGPPEASQRWMLLKPGFNDKALKAGAASPTENPSSPPG